MGAGTYWFGAVAIGVLAAAWRQVQGLLGRLAGLLVVTANVGSHGSYDRLGSSFLSYLRANFTQRCSPVVSYVSLYLPVRALRKHEHVVFEEFPYDWVVLWRGWRPLCVKRALNPSGYDLLQCRFLRGTFDMDALLSEAAGRESEDFSRSASQWPRFSVTVLTGSRHRYDQHATQAAPGSNAASQVTETTGSSNFLMNRERIAAARPVSARYDELGEDQDEGVSAVDALSLCGDCLEAAADVRRWYDSREWYKDRQIPWRYGLLLHGKPGTGKTAFVRALAKDLNMPVDVFDLASMDNRSFLDCWKRSTKTQRIVILFEDIDAVFNGRESLCGEDALTFDCFLNALGGAEPAEGVLVVITTNRPEAVDAAIGRTDCPKASRPGRIDRVVEMLPPDEDGRRKIAHRVLAGYEDAVEALVGQGDGDTGAQFVNRCREYALERFWREKGGAA